ncbi:MAG: hypothetical protein ACREJ9_12035 [Candidatus Rokuibacteriota bacterium]
MHTTAHYALVAAIVAGVVGALTVCLLTYAYGFTPDDGQPSAVRRRRSIARLGQGLAGLSFGLAAIAAVVGLLASSRASAAVDGRFQTLHGRVNDLVSTLQRLGDAADRLQTLVPTRGRLDSQAWRAEPSAGPSARPAVAQRPTPVDAGRPQDASVTVRDGDLVRAHVSVPTLEMLQSEALVSSTPSTPSPHLFPPRVTQPIGRPVPREAAPSASGAIPLAPEAPPAARFERVEPLRPPGEPSEATSISMAPAPRVPDVVEVPRAPEVNARIAPPAVLERRDRPERIERGERIERRERSERPERSGRRERAERPERRGRD